MFFQIKRIGDDWSDFELSIKRLNDKNWNNLQESLYYPPTTIDRINFPAEYSKMEPDVSESESESDSDMSE
jgi:hypothetical protein